MAMHVTWMVYILDINDTFCSSSFVGSHDGDLVSNSITWHAILGHYRHHRFARLARGGLLDSLSSFTYV